jgi:hypothetical protein
VREILECLCNSRIAQTGYAGHAATWPLALLWGGQAAVAASGCLLFVTRRRRRPPDPGIENDEISSEAGPSA